jgi:hypothetical protein
LSLAHYSGPFVSFNPGRRNTTDGPTTQQNIIPVLSQKKKLLVAIVGFIWENRKRNPRKTPGESAMATSAALRRAPWAAAATAARGLLGAMSVSRVPPPHRRLPYRAERSALLSSLSAPQPGAAADAHLLRVINYESSCAQKDCKKRDWVSDPAISLLSFRFGCSFLTVSGRMHKLQPKNNPRGKYSVFLRCGEIVFLEIVSMVGLFSPLHLMIMWLHMASCFGED